MRLPKMTQNKTDYVKCADMQRRLHQMQEQSNANPQCNYDDGGEVIAQLLFELAPETTDVEAVDE